MGTSPPCPLPVAVVPKVVSKVSRAGPGGGCAGLWAARGCLQGGCSARRTREGMRTGYPGAEEKEMMDLVSMMSHDQHTHGLACAVVQANCVQGSGAASGFLF